MKSNDIIDSNYKHEVIIKYIWESFFLGRPNLHENLCFCHFEAREKEKLSVKAGITNVSDTQKNLAEKFLCISFRSGVFC